MDQLATYEYAMEELRRTVATLDDSHMETMTNCEPWTVRRLASHALNNQLLWAGVVTGQQLVSADDTMGAVPLEGDLAPIADDVAARAMAMWGTEGLLEATHASPFGELPGSVIDQFRDHRCARPRLGPLVKRRTSNRVRAGGDSVRLDSRRADMHRRGAGDGHHQGRHRTTGRRD